RARRGALTGRFDAGESRDPGAAARRGSPCPCFGRRAGCAGRGEEAGGWEEAGARPANGVAEHRQEARDEEGGAVGKESRVEEKTRGKETRGKETRGKETRGKETRGKETRP